MELTNQKDCLHMATAEVSVKFFFHSCLLDHAPSFFRSSRTGITGNQLWKGRKPLTSHSICSRQALIKNPRA